MLSQLVTPFYISTRWGWYYLHILTVVFISFAFFTNNAEHCTWNYICIPGCDIYTSLTCLGVCSYVCLLFGFEHSVCIVDTSPLPDIWFVNSFSRFMTKFHPLVSALRRTNVFNFSKVYFVIFSIVDFVFDVRVKIFI